MGGSGGCGGGVQMSETGATLVQFSTVTALDDDLACTHEKPRCAHATPRTKASATLDSSMAVQAWFSSACGVVERSESRRLLARPLWGIEEAGSPLMSAYGSPKP